MGFATVSGLARQGFFTPYRYAASVPERVPPYAETRDYVPKVLAAFQVAKGLCQTPPELITDGCVFTVMN